MEVVSLVLSVVAAGITVGGGFLVSRRYQRLGGGEAQERLNSVLERTTKAMQVEMETLRTDFQACKVRLVEMEATVTKLREERGDLKQEIDDLHDEVRRLRPNRRGARDRASD